MSARLVRVRLRPKTLAALEAIAAERWTSVASECVEALARHLRAARPVRVGRVPMPEGVDVVVPLEADLWHEAKRVADGADVTIGQLCRLAAQAHARARPRLRRIAS